MFLSDFDYELPDELIARHPLAERRASRLLVVRDGIEDRQFPDFPAFLAAGDVLVVNDTQVIKARLAGRKTSGGRVEVMVERIVGIDRALAHVRASKSPKPGGAIRLSGDVDATVLSRSDDLFELQFSRPVAEVLDAFGEVPLPPYLGRAAEADDERRYQTVFAANPGAVAAPTAGLHFDRRMLATLEAAGVAVVRLTLHVGAGTFLPLRNERVAENRLHAERVDLSPDACRTIRRARQAGGRVFAVGTTSVRALESAAAGGELEPYAGDTDMFITPGYRFRVVDAMLTNFHLPKSSLMLLVAAFAGRERILDAYRHAVAARYRFFSYGDAMLLFPDGA